MSAHDDNESSARDLVGAAGFPGRFRPAVHGHEPHQEDIGQHPGADYVGYVNQPEDPETYTINRRGATAEDLITAWLSIDESAVVNLGDRR